MRACVCASVHPSKTEGQWKSVDPESKASASLDRATRRLREGCHRRRSRQHYLRVRALGRWARDRSEMVLDTHLCSRWLAKGPVPREAIGYGGSVEPGDCVPSFLQKSRERRLLWWLRGASNCVPSFLRADVSGEKRQEG